MFVFCERIGFLIKRRFSYEEMHFMKFIRCFGQDISIRFQVHARLPTSIFEFASQNSTFKFGFKIRFSTSPLKINCSRDNLSLI